MVHRFKKIMKLFFKKKEPVSSSPSSSNVPTGTFKIFRPRPRGTSSAAAPLDIDQETVLKLINKHKPSGNRDANVSKSFFSKYLPLPGIGEKEKKLVEKRRKLMRRDTYTVLDPVFVKGPPSPGKKVGHSPDCHGKKPKQNIKTQRISFKEKLKELRKNAKSIEETNNNGAFWVEM